MLLPVKNPIVLLLLAAASQVIQPSRTLVAADGADESTLGDENQQAPKDYSYSPKASRVRDLAGFFESMQRRSVDSSSEEKQDLVISLGEAASKLHLLMDGYSLELKCNRYVKLIDRPNIRTFSTVNLLANEDKNFNEIEQNDVNLLSRLQNERSFDALSKTQTIIQSLQSERSNMRSDYDPDVQADLLDCINYYIYRHQRATLGLIEYVREAKSKLGRQVTPSRLALEKYHEILESIKSIEEKEQQDKRENLAWLREFSKMYNIVLENQFELPKLVQDFVTEPKRLERLRAFDKVLSQIDGLENSILEHEADKPSLEQLDKNETYRRLLFKLADMVREFGDLLQERTLKLIEDPNRKRLIEDQAERDRLGKLADEENKTVQGDKVETTADDQAKVLSTGQVSIDAGLDETEVSSDQPIVDMDEDQFMKLIEEAAMKTAREFESEKMSEEQGSKEERQPTPFMDKPEPDIIARNDTDPAREKLKTKVVDLPGRYIEGFNGPASDSQCRATMDVAVEANNSNSACTKHALELSSSLRSFDDAGLEYDWSKSMASSMGKFLVNCLMRSSY